VKRAWPTFLRIHTNLRVNLCQIDAKRKLGRQNLLETERMQKDGNANGSAIQQKETTNKLHVLVGMLVQEDEKVDVKPQKVLGPKIKDLNRECSNFIKPFILGTSSSHATTGFGELGSREPGSNQSVWKEKKGSLQDLSWNGLLHVLTHNVVVKARSREGQQGEEDVFVDKRARQDSLVGVIASIFKFGQHLERKVSRDSLNHT
jgi:hypothetical protein